MNKQNIFKISNGDISLNGSKDNQSILSRNKYNHILLPRNETDKRKSSNFNIFFNEDYLINFAKKNPQRINKYIHTGKFRRKEINQ